MRILFLLLLLISNYVFADNFLKNYICESLDEATSCKKTCADNGNKVEFKVNPSSNVVQMTTKYHPEMKVPDTTTYLDGCKVLDKKNWQCSNKKPELTALGLDNEELITSKKGKITGIIVMGDIENYQCYR